MSPPTSAFIGGWSSASWTSQTDSWRWKLNLYARGPGELYDLNADPFELENLGDRPEHRDRVRDLTARVRQGQDETGDQACLPNG